MNISEIKKLRLSFKSVCHLLDIGRDGLNALIEKDLTFPRPIKDGNQRQSPVYFDYAELMTWYQSKKQSKEEASCIAAGSRNDQ